MKNSGFLIASRLFLLFGLISFFGFFTITLKSKKSLLFIAALVLILPFCYAPNILSNQSFFSLRAISPVAIIVLFYQFWFIRFLCTKRKALKNAIIILPIALLSMSAINQNKYIAGLQHKEYKILNKLFRNTYIKNVDSIAIIRADFGYLVNLGYINNKFSDEFGNLSSTRDWVPNHLFSQIKWEEQNTTNSTLEVFPVKNINVYTKETYIFKKNAKVIDLLEVLKTNYLKE